MLSVFDKHLDRFEILNADDSRMTVPIEILVPVLAVLFVFMLVKIRRKCLPGQDVSAVALI